MKFRESINNLIRGDKPESPTDAIFLYGALMFIAVWVYCNMLKMPVQNIIEMASFLTGCKGVKVASNWVKGKINAGSNPEPDKPTN